MEMCALGTAKCHLTSPTKGFKCLFDLCTGSQLCRCWGCCQWKENSSGCLIKSSFVDKDIPTEYVALNGCCRNTEKAERLQVMNPLTRDFSLFVVCVSSTEVLSQPLV